jgi:type II secretory pathway pseudopilin PulG
MIELLIAIVVMNIALISILGAMMSGQVAIRKAGRTTTAGSLADAQLELYRALKYTAIALDQTSVNATDTTYRNDTALGGSIANDITTTTGCTGVPNECNPSRLLTGPDHGSYRVDTYVVSSTPSGGRAGKLVTIVVRDGSNVTGTPLVRETAMFDQATGQ